MTSLPRNIILRPTTLIATLFLCGLTVTGQKTNQYDPGTPPQHAAGISQLGSYASADLGTVNLSNGSLNFKIPLGTVGGRGFSIPITLNYSSKLWSASRDTDQDLGGTTYTVAFADFEMGDNSTPFNQRIGLGWTIGGAPWLTSTNVNIDRITSGPWIGCPSYKLPKLTLTLPDKGEVEFRDDATDGAPLSNNCSTGTTASRGVRWHATDGSGMIFINDVGAGVQAWPVPNLSGVVVTADGMRYRFGAGGLAESITDRHGNTISIQGSTYTDQLGRVTTIQRNINDPETGMPLAALVTFPAYNGQVQYIKIKDGLMNQHYRSDLSVALPVVTGNYDPKSLYQNWPTPGTVLFAHSYKLYQQRVDDRDVLTEVILPNDNLLRFKYNEFGEVAEVEMPTGGKVQYDYSAATSLPAGNSPVWETTGDLHTVVRPDRAVRVRRIYPNGVTSSTPKSTWSYGYSQNVSVIAREGSSSGPVISHTVHRFLEPLRYTHAPIFGNPDGTYYSRWTTGVEWRTETLNPSGTVIAATEQDWTQRAPVAWNTYAQEQPANDNRVNESRKVLDTGAMAKTQFSYDQYNNPIEVKEFDYDQVLMRRQVTSYVNNTTPINGLDYTGDAIHLIRLPRQSFTYDGQSNVAAKSEINYDESSYPLLTYGAVTGWNNPGTTARGNPTTSRQWINISNNWIEVHVQFDQCGSVRKTWDPKGNLSQIDYAATYHFAYPTLTISPVPDPMGQTGSNTSLTASTAYDFNTGLVTAITDANNQTTSFDYNDPFGRVTHVTRPTGGGSTSYSYSDVPGQLHVRVQMSLDVSRVMESYTFLDGLGRPIEQRHYEGGSNYIAVQTQYDALGRAFKTSNPFRPWQSESAVWTTTTFDLQGRVISVTTPDNAVVSTAYSGKTVTVTDQAGKQRKSETDALGRLTHVYEDPNELNYLTSYTYDVLDNLTTVSQGSHTRTFAYDSLKRLMSAANPESGTINYAYDGNGNLLTKTDARGVVSTYVYDALNRAIARSYSDGTPTVNYVYEGAGVANSKGRLTSVSSIVSSYSYSGYDAMGRVLAGVQTIGAKTYPTSYSYDLAGNIETMTYPSGRIVNYSYDTAGRLNSFNGNLGDGSQRNYTTGIIYDAGSRMTKEQFGTATPIYNKLFYNSRGQLAEIRASTSYTGPTDMTWDRGAIINHYSNQAGCSGASCDATDNNGILRRQQIYIPNSDTFTQFYEYDALNRLQSARENHNGGATTWQQTYTYDRYGNRRIDTNPAQTFGGVNNLSFELHTDTNRLLAPGDLALAEPSRRMRYDAVGNLKKDTYTGAGDRTYDAENRMITSAGTSAASYAYDGDGRRVRRTIGTTETWQVYGIGGELLAEYAANGSNQTPQKEYGYRNGQLLITAAANSGWGAPPTFTGPNPLVSGLQIKLENLTELRTAVNQLRQHAGLPVYNFTVDPNPVVNVTTVKADHVRQLRIALEGARSQLGLSTGGYAHSTLTENSSLIYAIDFQELRSQILSAWNGGGGVEISWLVADHLGTPRMIFDQTGTLAGVKRHDYLPFGEELFIGGRETLPSYSGDNVRQKFTLKERDSETGLDYFGARYYGSSQGRFTSADPLMLGLKQVVNPQRWNRYAYVVNNPLALYDPDGQDDQGQGGSKIIDVFIAMPPDGQQDYRTVNGRPAGNYPSPDWSKLQENAAKAGYTVNVHQLSGSTPEAVANSFRTAELTVIVGHGIDLAPQNPTKFTSDAAAISGGLVRAGGIQPATMEGGNMIATGEATSVSGTGVVGLFTCNSTDVLSSGFPNQTVVSNDGGGDGLTTVGTLQQAAFGFVGTYVDTGGNVNAAVATGQRVINTASNRVVNDPAANGARATNAGDRLHIRVRRREEE